MTDERIRKLSESVRKLDEKIERVTAMINELADCLGIELESAEDGQ